ncbi:hypothetical protein FQN57_001928 [Myotisia sp. PD_48]|nr:hypothetical protein FQN57_001928 [Myotisia sp. PD_48]
MPPANSPSEMPSGPSTPFSSSPYLRQLESITSPVPDFAATLMSNPNDEVHDDNVRFLRSRRRSSNDIPQSRSQNRRRNAWTTPDHLNETDLNELRSLRGHFSGPVWQSNGSRHRTGNNGFSYEDPPQGLQRLYNWASTPERDGSHSLTPDGNALARARRDEFFFFGRATRGSTIPVIGAPQPTTTSDSPISTRRDNSALLTAALLQSARRHPRFPPRERAIPEIPNSERSREETRGEDSRAFVGRSAPNQGTTRPNRMAAMRNDISRSSNLRTFVKDPSMERLRETIQYLDRLRFSSSYEESISTVTTKGIVQFEYLRRNEDDFIFDTGSIGKPDECSWLRPGTVFTGHQQASYALNPAALHRRHRRNDRLSDPVIVNGSDGSRISVYTSSGRDYMAPPLLTTGVADADNTKSEQWPVKVTIHEVNYEDMTLSGTMEAYNIPDKTATNQGAHIITFLEGEIIDFNTHTLETKNFNAGPDVDCCYWKELEPFKSLTYGEIVNNLLSKKWITEKLSEGWILMRWKEKCFVSPSHSRQGLTISGFYYISLHRDTGRIEGMYFDPGSSPYQQLSLNPENHGGGVVFPAYSFR